jgi:hypothetical protein
VAAGMYRRIRGDGKSVANGKVQDAGLRGADTSFPNFSPRACRILLSGKGISPIFA